MQPRKSKSVKRNSKPVVRATVAARTIAKSAQSPWDEFAGMFKNDADYANVKKTIAAYRRQLDRSPSIP